MAKQGLYANIHAKRKRIAAGSGEKRVSLAARVRLLLPTFDNQQKLQRKSNA